MAKLNKLLKRLKSLNSRGGRRRSHACSRTRTRKNTTRRNRH
jgi:hypothetical protein